ncbi:solute carrier family 35 member D3-like isoform X1 [Echeneis naucrates]|uniref:solute carrier family 35 member D3-like n=1 Tax=Echeneis naucrates TaxID=173247 RepID=UPI0011142E27|nr:solute carrier family 35 member D3-like [Echeneis naucrates]XP_029352389.1 solute carrier family 35 member D3-like isoform X1 [Echeneis naucrates]
MDVFKSRMLGISVAVAHGVFSGSLNILLKFLITNYHFNFLTLIQFLTSSTAALTLETLRRLGKVKVPAFSLQLAKEFVSVCVLSTLQSTLTLWSLRGLSLPMYVVFKRCLPLFTLSIGVCVLRNGVPSVGVVTAVLITTGGAALAGAGDLTGDPFGYVTGVLAVIIHASYLVLIQKTSLDSEYGPLTAQYAIAIMASPVLLVCSLISMDAINMWSYEGWRDPHITVIFVFCIFIGCAMNFTTLHCTYINSAVTTSFVGVVKSIATITVGMLAFNDVAPTGLFIGGVVVNTVGSITYCVVKYFETKKKSSYEDLEVAGKDGAPPGEPYQEKPPLNGDGPAAGTGADPGQLQMEGVPSVNGKEESPLANGQLWTGDGGQGDAEAGVNSCVMTEKEALEMQREHLNKEGSSQGQTLSDSYVGVWRSIRHLQFLKKEPLIDNMEQQSP